MKFLPLLNLAITHNYYNDSRCPDFYIEATADTTQRLKNYRCVLKALPNGLRILTAVTDNDKQFIPLQSGLKFTFQLRLQNPDFALFTDLTAIKQQLAPLYTNLNLSLAEPVQLTLTSRQASSTESFAILNPATENSFTLSGRPLAGLQSTDFRLEGLAASNPLAYDARAKMITINSQTKSEADLFKATYPIRPQLANGVLADVEIHCNDSLPQVTYGPAEFEITFQSKKARWKYYLIADKSEAQFYIEDKDSSPLTFSADNQTNLNEHPDSSDHVAQLLAEQYPDKQRLRFVSDNLVSCQQAARKSLQLYLNGNQVMEALPNPSLRNYSSMNIISNREWQKEDALFQIVKYITHQFQTTGG